MATRTMRPKATTTERQNRSTKEEAPQPPRSYPQTKTRKGNRATFKRDESSQIPMVEEYCQHDNYNRRNNPNSDPGDSSEPGSDDDSDNDDDGIGNNNSGTRWTPMVDNFNQENAMVSGNKRPKVPTPPKMNADTTWSTAHKFDNWVQELLHYLAIYNIDAQDPQRKDAIVYTYRYREGIAKEFIRTWRLRADNLHKSLVDFLNDLRNFCVPSTDNERIWEEFAQVKQTVNGVSRPIQIVANELKVLQMRVAKLSPKQLYMQLKNAMDPELRTIVTPHINATMHWQDLIGMAMKFDKGRRYSKQTRNSDNYQCNKQNHFKSYSQNNTRSYNSNQNNNKKPWNKGWAHNSNWKQKNNWTPKTTYSKNANKSGKDLSTIKCFNCNEMGNYANKCPSPKKSDTSAAQQVRFKPT